ncbi:MAG TPA: thiamine pyrophosphate-dependent enzyme, partial [bacterium]|nr:thiamine pyrophosphate-dependent enzyme [bacterium]
ADAPAPPVAPPPVPTVSMHDVERARAALSRAQRPVLVAGSQCVLEAGETAKTAEAIAALGVPVYLSGMARGLLGAKHPVLFRHKRREALREADLVILAGVPCDFRLDYGRHIRGATPVVAVNRSRADLTKNRRPDVAVLGDPGRFLRALASSGSQGERLAPWKQTLGQRDADREREIDAKAKEPAEGGVNPVALCREIEKAMAPESVIVADGGDFVGTASYTLNPRAPLTWLDPGVFGTLGVGAGFAIGAAVNRPGSEVWIVFGDGSLGYSLIEFDSFTRHGLAPIAVVGNDGSWAQIARDQIEILKDDVGTVLRRADYHKAAEGLGAKGLLLDDIAKAPAVLAEAKALAKQGHAVLVNAILGRSDFRKGSISI